jgi:hypothetical protein
VSAALYGGNKKKSGQTIRRVKIGGEFEGVTGFGGHFRAVQGFRYLGER